jgi:hypothetical protein
MFDNEWDEHLEHFRKCEFVNVDIRRPDAIGTPDNHGNTWYCFSCKTGRNGSVSDHRSFQCAHAFMCHLYSAHGILTPAQSNLWEKEKMLE